jgi:hypothetical protein
MDHFWTSVVTILTAIIGLAILAVIVGKGSQSVGVINAASSGFAGILKAATGPLGTNGGLSIQGFSVPQFGS